MAAEKLRTEQHAGAMGCLGFTLARLGLAVNARMQAAMSVTGLKPRQCLALLHLSESGAMSQLSLAKALQVDPSVLVSILNELERRELARRRREPSDRRRHIVELTERGREVVSVVERSVSEVERELFAGLSPAERVLLTDMLSRIAPDDPVDCEED
ncbi:MarR family winged helix-turn-helix transcriptional regulator [Bailinhaonella thermotolerans]|uniref:MarR family transcriptional regulator n=1 Tax=Bailinhaonella thermotolerans TaxID=1070861 RepID=A0A3A4B497_9ACTN|nr:MarR family winged helix-turn-helix transcriptional regulator [Bailinhaonella thermotolerans]RJL32190.1 MarR family transcriptional regulator [Bailinhaonella thermotolerans]